MQLSEHSSTGKSKLYKELFWHNAYLLYLMSLMIKIPIMLYKLVRVPTAKGQVMYCHPSKLLVGQGLFFSHRLFADTCYFLFDVSFDL
jgi:hypothetical protein